MLDYLAKSQEITTKLLEWKVKRKDTVRLIRSAGQEIQRNHKNVNIAKLTGASASIVGAGLAIGGFVASFFTFGGGRGISLATGGGVTVGGSSLTEHLLPKSDVKVVSAALEDDREATRELHEMIKKIKPSSYLCFVKSAVGIGVAVDTGVKTVFTTGGRVAAATASGGRGTRQNLGHCNKGFALCWLLSFHGFFLWIYTLWWKRLSTSTGDPFQSC